MYNEESVIPADEFSKLIADHVKPLMKSYGFKKKGLYFYKDVNELCFIVHFQKSSGNTQESLRFFINCGIFSRTISRVTGKHDSAVPKEYECHYRQRIEQITNKDYKHYTFKTRQQIELERLNQFTDVYRANSDTKSTINLVIEDLKTALPILLNINDTHELVDLMLTTGQGDYKTMSHYLLKTGQLDKFDTYYNYLYENLGHEDRWARIDKIFSDIKTQVGL